ncbi:MAG: hypothetical protein A2X25_08430 [Chloroflexi bacterium GWB2_49_20]|nr:MAG: hypothetical protein A2X25_08430 [Chloroflexi bacterium GWB2_49_20]OGN79539.1 MAG: hypothetical protein A2X26_05595 [Chloroflexi bacterium GWC2_49_37]OGN84538.1 MAG: hypothetical protein A2X27_10935 [Chloroflexi bacterium GWD2_49_16]HBG74038.1 hypothetical protein [Anaerolineae bacterium]HCC78840.1 hypothetical protein [Anaerolineae bacterium]
MKERSLFWPFVMIATGFVWLMVNLGKIPTENLWALTQVWPYLLMALGVGLIVRSFWRHAGMLFSGLIVLAAVLAILYAPQFGWNVPQDWNAGRINIGRDFTGAIPGSGVVVSEKREVSAFTSLDVRYRADVTIKQGETDSVAVETDDNLMPQLRTRVSNGTLIIENSITAWNQRVNPSDKIVITITVKDLREVDFPSAGEIWIEGIQSDHLKLSVSGTGNVSLIEVGLGKCEINLSGVGSTHASGSVDLLDVDISGAGSFNGSDLKAKSASANISGVGSAKLWVVNDLTANISGVGSVNYYGSPNVQKNVSGLGKVSGLGEK